MPEVLVCGDGTAPTAAEGCPSRPYAVAEETTTQLVHFVNPGGFHQLNW
jgi:hypothetical protein